MTKQEAFTIVKNHLLTQNKKARTIGCAYLTPEGLKCAVGCMIPKDRYDEDIEGESVENIFDQYEDLLLLSDLDHNDSIDFWLGLQHIHDERHVQYWPEALQTFAKDWEINYDCN